MHTPAVLSRLKLRHGMILFIAVALAATAACSSSEPEPRVEEFPAFLLGTWEPQTGVIGTIRFEGSELSGVAIRSADGVQAESFTYQWVAPAIIRTNLENDAEFTVLFEDGGKTLVLATVAAATSSDILRYSKIR